MSQSVACPNCGQKAVFDGRNVICLNCSNNSGQPTETETPPPSPPPIVPRFEIETDAPRPGSTPAITPQDSTPAGTPQDSLGQSVVKWAFLGGACGAALGGFGGIVASQFFPLWGGFLATIAEPFSPARLHLLVGHFFGCGIAGGAVGAMVLSGLRYVGWISGSTQMVPAPRRKSQPTALVTQPHSSVHSRRQRARLSPTQKNRRIAILITGVCVAIVLTVVLLQGGLGPTEVQMNEDKWTEPFTVKGNTFVVEWAAMDGVPTQLIVARESDGAAVQIVDPDGELPKTGKATVSIGPGTYRIEISGWSVHTFTAQIHDGEQVAGHSGIMVIRLGDKSAMQRMMEHFQDQ